MNQGFAIVGGLVFLLIRFVFPLGDAILLPLPARSRHHVVCWPLERLVGASRLAGRTWRRMSRRIPVLSSEFGSIRPVFALLEDSTADGTGGTRATSGSPSDPAQGSLGPVESDPDVVAYCRNLIEFGSSLVDARPLESTSFRGIVCVLKMERRPGYVYAGRLHVLLEHHSVIFFLVADEQGVTGRREAVVTTEALRAGVIELDAAAGKVKHWFKDAYDSNYRLPHGPQHRRRREL